MSRILVVDDEIEICRVLEQFLVGKGHDVAMATSGQEGLLKVKEWEPDIVLLDILMPDIKGTEVLHLVKEIDKRIGVIMITGLYDEEIGRKLLSEGADDYITKPFDLDYLGTSVTAKLLSMGKE
jgi:DNA-binding response OmpR family regulator